MLRGYKTEIFPTVEQADKICHSIDICRWLYNEYIAKNRRLYSLYQRGCLDRNQKRFMSGYDFDKYVNNKLKNCDEFAWITECGSKARKKAIMDAEMALKLFFQKKSRFPRFKKKNKQNMKIYFPKNGKGDWTVKRHWVQVPTIGKIRLKEFGYLPVGVTVKSGTVSRKAGRFYVSVVVDMPELHYAKPRGEPIGIDLGLKDLAILSNGIKYKNINKTTIIKRLKKKIKT